MGPNPLLEEVAKAGIRELHRRAERERLALTLRRRREETAATLDAPSVTSRWRALKRALVRSKRRLVRGRRGDNEDISRSVVRILVAGATGTIGRRLMPLLLGAGHHARG